MTTIAIDCRFAGTGTGLARYSKELVSALLTRRTTNVRYVLLVRKTSDIEGVTAPHTTVMADIPHYSVQEQTRLPAIIESTKADLVFFPHFNVPFFCRTPFVATVHDLILHRYPGEAPLTKRMAYRILVHRALRRAKHIIAVSEWTKSDIRETYGKRIAKKTTVIGHGVNESYQPQSLERVTHTRAVYGLSRPFFLYVGNTKPHKNLPLLIEAFAQARPDADLILVSGGSDVQTLSLPPSVRILCDVPDADLPMLYSAARAFVTASLEEGFCLPAAEALACGCPVIAANRSALPDVVGSHGLLVEPTMEEFAEAFLNPPTLSEPIRVGSWGVAAHETERLLLEHAKAGLH